MNTNDLAQTAKVEVINILGQVVYSAVAANNNGTINTNIALNNQASGFYMVRVVCGNDVQDAKLQVVR